MHKNKGFTLLELLIVIGILAILATVAILVLNPAELMKRSRDSARISDLASIKSAVGIYLTDVSPVLLGGVNSTICAGGNATGTIWVSAGSDATDFGTCPAGGVVSGTTIAIGSVTKANLGKVDGTGWLPVDLTDSSTGSPLGNIPLDPSNTCSATADKDLIYAYSCNNHTTSFVLVSHMESIFYGSPTGTNYVSSKDGGLQSTVYEVGTDLATSGPAAALLIL